jgi:hypothetical protein
MMPDLTSAQAWRDVVAEVVDRPRQIKIIERSVDRGDRCAEARRGQPLDVLAAPILPVVNRERYEARAGDAAARPSVSCSSRPRASDWSDPPSNAGKLRTPPDTVREANHAASNER